MIPLPPPVLSQRQQVRKKPDREQGTSEDLGHRPPPEMEACRPKKANRGRVSPVSSDRPGTAVEQSRPSKEHWDSQGDTRERGSSYHYSWFLERGASSDPSPSTAGQGKFVHLHSLVEMNSPLSFLHTQNRFPAKENPVPRHEAMTNEGHLPIPVLPGLVEPPAAGSSASRKGYHLRAPPTVLQVGDAQSLGDSQGRGSRRPGVCEWPTEMKGLPQLCREARRGLLSDQGIKGRFPESSLHVMWPQS